MGERGVHLTLIWYSMCPMCTSINTHMWTVHIYFYCGSGRCQGLCIQVHLQPLGNISRSLTSLTPIRTGEATLFFHISAPEYDATSCLLCLCFIQRMIIRNSALPLNIDIVHIWLFWCFRGLVALWVLLLECSLLCFQASYFTSSYQCLHHYLGVRDSILLVLELPSLQFGV